MCENGECSCIGTGIDSAFQAAYDYANFMESAIIFYGRNFEFDTLADRMDAVASGIEEIIESDLDAGLIEEATITLQETGFLLDVNMDDSDDNNGFRLEVVFGDDNTVTINALPFIPDEEETDIDDLPEEDVDTETLN